MKLPQKAPSAIDILSKKGPVIQDLFTEENLKLAADFNSKYLHWDEIRRRDTKEVDAKDIWAVTSILRENSRVSLNIGGIPIKYTLIDSFQRSMHEIDRRFSGALLSKDMADPKAAKKYSISSLMEESIASSQVEGAVTTTRIAKAMLREGRRPMNESERMIYNNYKAMQLIKENKEENLTLELILKLHETITKDTLEDQSSEGRLRGTDDIVVQDGLTGDVFHEPPQSSAVPDMVKGLCDYANSDEPFLHPIIKGTVLHFLIAYIHPFVDGNGRLARSILYWYALKKGYDVFEFLAISKIIKEHRGKYDMSYALSETDGNDITYFIRYNLECIEEAMETFLKYLDRKSREYKELASAYEEYDLNLRQRSILRDAMRSGESFSISEVQSTYQVSYQTAASDIHKMESIGILKKAGKQWNRVMYVISEKSEKVPKYKQTPASLNKWTR
jgi:Fic family protein